MIGAGVLGVIAVIAAVVILTGDDEPADEDVISTTEVGTDDSATDDSEESNLAVTEVTECPPVDGTGQRAEKFAGPPPMCIDAATTDYSATFETTEGPFTAELYTDSAPETVNNFVVLSREGYYEGVPFHRIVPEFVIQAGDGDGEPWGNNDLGYTIDDELPDSSDEYVDYALAMANAGPNTNGSQFFVVLPGGGARLTPAFSLFGQVIEGQDTVDAIGALGDAQQQPTKEVLINSVSIAETPK